MTDSQALYEALCKACKEGSLPRVKRLLSPRRFMVFRWPRIDLNNAKGSWRGNVPLVQASNEGHKDIAGLLLAKRADVNASDCSKRTALQEASEHGHAGIVELPLAKGANVGLTNVEHKTALILAWERRHNAIADLLLAKGIDVYEPNTTTLLSRPRTDA